MAAITNRPSHSTTRPACDSVLAQRLRAGDPVAFEQLYRRHHQRLARLVAARLAATRGSDDDTVDDLVQDTFCTAIADPAAFVDDDVYGCLRRIAIRHARAAHRRRVTGVETLFADNAHLDNPVEAPRGDAEALWQAVAGLAPDQRRVIELLYLDGQPKSSVAQAIGRPTVAVARLRRRGLARLRQQLTGNHHASVPVEVGGDR